jgi:hypothetical protein
MSSSACHSRWYRRAKPAFAGSPAASCSATLARTVVALLLPGPHLLVEVLVVERGGRGGFQRLLLVGCP